MLGRSESLAGSGETWSMRYKAAHRVLKTKEPLHFEPTSNQRLLILYFKKTEKSGLGPNQYLWSWRNDD